jgi:ferric-dicitrate binding protein FerR (iron transport regulator)
VVDVNEAFESTDRERFLVRLQLETGRIWSRFETVFGPAAYFEVRASNTVAVAIGTSFGMKLTPKTVAVDVMESHVQVLRVHDRPATQREIAAGSGDMVAEKVGIEVILGPKQKMDMAVDAGKLPAPQAMSDAELKDPFIQKGNQRMTAEELNIAPSASAPSAAASTKLFP